jgi:hypothetical protein
MLSREALEEHYRPYNINEGFFCGPGRFSWAVPMGDVPSFSIDQHNDGSIEIQFDAANEDSLSTLPKVKTFDQMNIINFVHNFTFAIFGTNLDQKLSEHFNPLRNRDDSLTPDLIFRVESTRVVFEFTTCFSRNQDKSRESYELKAFKYGPALEERQIADQVGVDFFVIVATHEGVYHNVRFMPQETIDELAFRYKVAIAIRERLVQKGLLSALDKEQISFEMKGAEDILRSIPMDFGDPKIFKPFTEEDYKAWTVNDFNSEYIQRQVVRSLELSKLDIKKSQEPCDINKMIEDYKLKCREGERRNDCDIKSVCVFPLWCPRFSHNGTSDITIDDFPSLLLNSTHPEIKVWLKVRDELLANRIQRVDDEHIKADENFNKETGLKNNKLHYHRVDIEVDLKTSIELAKVGVHAKKFKDLQQVSSYRDSKKKPMTLDVNTSQITDFLNSGSEMLKTITSPNYGVIKSLNLLEHSSKLHRSNATTDLFTFTNKLMGSNLGVFSSFISDLATELDISLRQHVKSNEAIIKKLRHSNILLLIVPTNSSGHIFFSLLCKKESLINDKFYKCFMDTKMEGDYCFTQFVSVNVAKLENLSKFESTMITMVSYWHSFFEVPYWLDGNFLDGEGTAVKRIWFNTLLCLLVSLSDKEQVEEHITMSRYLCMEGFVEKPLFPRPEKMIEKFTTTPRSTLCVWVIQKLLRAIPRVKNGFGVNIKGGDMYWNDLFNPWDGEQLRSPNQLISCFYLGYLKNKNENCQKNSLTKLYTKVIEMEEKMPENDNNLSQGDPEIDDIKTHEFSISFMKFLVAHGQQYLKKNLGQNWREIVDTRILEMMSSYTIEEFSTLKASSNYGPSWFSPRNQTEAYKRRKVIEAVRPLLIETESKKITHVIHLLNLALTDFNDGESLNVDVFPKGQHGGQREITVLDVKARICQLMVELIARALCSFFECETMMHPKNKSRIPEQHFREAKKDCGKTYITSSTSDDATKWCQGHFVSKFGLMLVQLTGEKFHSLIIRTLRMWMNKRMMISESIISTIQEHGLKINTNDDCFQKMVKGFMGKQKVNWMDQGKTYIKVRTGMMQGILHYTSSLLHALFITFMVSFSKRGIDSVLAKAGIKGKCVVSGMESSDDSEMTISSPVHEKSQLPIVLGAHAVMFRMKAHLSKLIGVETSVKSTTGTVGAMEFNSEFHFGQYQYKPTIRWVAAACMVSERESIASRQEEMANLLTNVLEGGGSMFMTSLCQVAQGLLHYRLMGSSVSPFFDDYSSLLMNSCDPAFGYFLMDHPMAAGMAGFQYNLWNCVKKTSLGIKYHHFIEQQEKDARDPLRDATTQKRVLETTGTGAFVQGTLIRWGNREKLRNIMRSLELPSNWLEMTDENPSLIYEKPSSTDDVIVRLAIKMSSPGVSESLSKGNALSRIIASSVYVLSHHVITESNYWLLDANEKPGKRPLLVIMKEMQEKLKELEHSLDDRELTTLFPFRLDYESLSANLEQFSDLAGIVEPDRFRKVTTRVEISETDGITIVSPLKLVTWKWFKSVSIPASESVLERLWTNLKSSLPYLKDTAEESLKESPFVHQIQLFNHIKKQEKRKRVVNLSGVPIRSRAGLSNVVTAVYQDFFPGFKLATQYDIAKKYDNQKMSTLMHCIHMILTSPQSEARKKNLVTEMIKNCGDLPYNQGVVASRRNFVCIIQKYLTDESEESVKDFIYQNKQGIMGGFTRKQSYNDETGKYEGKGTWVGIFGKTNVSIHINSDKAKSYIEKVYVSSGKNIRDILLLLKHWCSQMEVKNDKIPEYSSVSKSQSVIATFMNFEPIVSSNPRGALLILDEDLEYAYDPEEVGELSLTISGMTIRLNATYGTRKKSYLTLLSFTSKDKDVMTNIGLMNTDSMLQGLIEPFKSWVLQRPVTVDTANEVIRRLMEQPKEGDDLKIGWLKSCFRGSIRRLGFLGPGQMASLNLPDDSETDESMVDGIIDGINIFQFTFRGASEVMNWAAEIAQEPTIEAEDIPFMDNDSQDRMFLIANELMGDFEDDVPKQDKVMVSHSLLDNLLTNWIKQFKWEQMEDLIDYQIYTPSTAPIVSKISFLMGVPMDSFHLREYKESEVPSVSIGDF